MPGPWYGSSQWNLPRRPGHSRQRRQWPRACPASAQSQSIERDTENGKQHQGPLRGFLAPSDCGSTKNAARPRS